MNLLEVLELVILVLLRFISSLEGRPERLVEKNNITVMDTIIRYSMLALCTATSLSVCNSTVQQA